MTFAQQAEGAVSPVSLELIGKARELGGPVTAVLPGSNAGHLALELIAHGADRVVVIDDPALAVYTTEYYTQALCAAVSSYQPDILLIGATAIGRDLGPRVAARLHTGLTADCTGLEIDPESGNLLMTRPAFGGNLMATIICPEHRPQMATVRPGVMVRALRDEIRQGEITHMDMKPEWNRRCVTVEEVIMKRSKKVDIQQARVLVSGGRGVGSADGFKLLEELAKALDGEVAASRAAVDAGWLDKDSQVGQTGKTVRPGLYFAIGISGAIQHLAGMEESDYIIAINKDPQAPIFSVADAGIVGDYSRIVPKLIEELGKQ
ncbi:MAG: electron transfer flavoprotein subunit alpha/FixB family protein [Clostridiales bacterium]|nr:electron transfer flavoprotein subunit alpha/FixB family protein [Clostridiales bacterium]